MADVRHQSILSGQTRPTLTWVISNEAIDPIGPISSRYPLVPISRFSSRCGKAVQECLISISGNGSLITA
jgi:hypothetical protein